jgi:hypothetical protein
LEQNLKFPRKLKRFSLLFSAERGIIDQGQCFLPIIYEYSAFLLRFGLCLTFQGSSFQILSYKILRRRLICRIKQLIVEIAEQNLSSVKVSRLFTRRRVLQMSPYVALIAAERASSRETMAMAAETVTATAGKQY